MNTQLFERDDTRADEAMSPFARTAPAWRAAGWRGTLPLPARKKGTPPKGYTGEDGGWPSDEQVAAWCVWTDANACLRLPERHCGLDLDVYKDGAPEAHAEWI